MINSRKQIPKTDFFLDTLSVRNDLGSTKDETLKYEMNSHEKNKLDDSKALEIKMSKINSEVY